MKNKIAVYSRGNSQKKIEYNKKIVNFILENNHFLDDNNIITYYEDIGYSGRDDHRPDLEALILAMENKEVDVLVVPKLETLSRNVLLLEFKIFPTILDFGVEVYTINGKENIKEAMLPNEILREKMKEIYGGFENEI